MATHGSSLRVVPDALNAVSALSRDEAIAVAVADWVQRRRQPRGHRTF
jgi:hypothetical protein